LQKKGYSPIQADFLQWESDLKFDRVILNPPYSKNRALDHLKKAHQYLANDGRLVAILPASMKEKEFFPDLTHEWSEVLSNEFRESGTGVNVVILTLYR
jgi:16S rRNA G1207 methylase RsmC